MCLVLCDCEECGYVWQEEPIERRAPPELPKEHFGHRILVKCLQLS